VLFIGPLLVGMRVMLVDEDSPDKLMVMVALMVLLVVAVVLVLMDALAASGFITFSYAEQFPFGAIGQLSYICQQGAKEPEETRHHNRRD
jgi:hypothetical protein